MPSYPRNHWDPDFHGYVYLIEFLATKWPRPTRPAKPKSDAETIRDEIPKLIRVKRDRTTDRLKEILDQAITFSQVFPRRLMFTPASHPRTFEVVKVAVLLGRAVGMYYKDDFQRARPSQLSTEIDPVIDVPGHASYPSGHATQAHLIAHALCQLHPRGTEKKWADPIFKLAARVAVNREVAGVHYPSDSAAGVRMAKSMFHILRDKKQCPKFCDLLEEAHDEWMR